MCSHTYNYLLEELNQYRQTMRSQTAVDDILRLGEEVLTTMASMNQPAPVSIDHNLEDGKDCFSIVWLGSGGNGEEVLDEITVFSYEEVRFRVYSDGEMILCNFYRHDELMKRLEDVFTRNMRSQIRLVSNAVS